jgi:hypothetical protein
MTGEYFGTKIFYSEIGGHVLTPFFGTSLVYDEAKELADWPMWRRSQCSGINADGLHQ